MKPAFPVVVIGGGPAGAMAAAQLARAGRDVIVLERERGPVHKVCGEFVSYEAQAYLRRVGVEPLGLGAVPIDHTRLFSGKSDVVARLPFRALSLSRRAMDEALLDCAGRNGAEVRRGMRVTGLVRQHGGWQVSVDDADPLQAAEIFLATGKHDLRGYKRPAGSQPDLIGFKSHYRLTPDQTARLSGVVELHTFEGGYAGLELIEDGIANLCLLVRRQAFARVGRTWEGLMGSLQLTCQVLRDRLGGAEPLTARPFAISSIPYGYVRRRSDGVWRLGDQAAVIPSFAGDGVSIAMHSAQLAAEAYLSNASADAFQRRLARDVRLRVAGATLISQALVRPAAQGAIAALASARPRLLALVASATRLPVNSVGRLAFGTAQVGLGLYSGAAGRAQSALPLRQL